MPFSSRGVTAMTFLVSIPDGKTVEMLQHLESISGVEVRLCASEEAFRAGFIGNESLTEIKETLAKLGLSLLEA